MLLCLSFSSDLSQKEKSQTPKSNNVAAPAVYIWLVELVLGEQLQEEDICRQWDCGEHIEASLNILSCDSTTKSNAIRYLTHLALNILCALFEDYYSASLRDETDVLLSPGLCGSLSSWTPRAAYDSSAYT